MTVQHIYPGNTTKGRSNTSLFPLRHQRHRSLRERMKKLGGLYSVWNRCCRCNHDLYSLRLQEQLDVALSKTCKHFDVLHYNKVQLAYTLLGKTQVSAPTGDRGWMPSSTSCP